jgi:hypothetical protein
MSFELNLEGGFGSNSKDTNVFTPKDSPGTSEKCPRLLASRAQVDSTGHKLRAIHSGFKSSFGVHTTLARDNRRPGAKVRGQNPALRAGRDGIHLAKMDGGNLQVLIAPKEPTYDSSPKSHMGGGGRRKVRSHGKWVSQQNWTHLRNGRGCLPILACPVRA